MPGRGFFFFFYLSFISSLPPHPICLPLVSFSPAAEQLSCSSPVNVKLPMRGESEPDSGPGTGSAQQHMLLFSSSAVTDVSVYTFTSSSVRFLRRWRGSLEKQPTPRPRQHQLTRPAADLWDTFMSLFGHHPFISGDADSAFVLLFSFVFISPSELLLLDTNVLTFSTFRKWVIWVLVFITFIVFRYFNFIKYFEVFSTHLKTFF